MIFVLLTASGIAAEPFCFYRPLVDSPQAAKRSISKEYEQAIPKLDMAEKLFGENKYLEAAKAYHDAGFFKETIEFSYGFRSDVVEHYLIAIAEAGEPAQEYGCSKSEAILISEFSMSAISYLSGGRNNLPYVLAFARAKEHEELKAKEIRTYCDELYLAAKEDPIYWFTISHRETKEVEYLPSNKLLIWVDFSLRNKLRDNAAEIIVSMLVSGNDEPKPENSFGLSQIQWLNSYLPLELSSDELLTRLANRKKDNGDVRERAVIDFLMGELYRYKAAYSYWQAQQEKVRLSGSANQKALNFGADQDSFFLSDDVSQAKSNIAQTIVVRLKSLGIPRETAKQPDAAPKKPNDTPPDTEKKK
jgi:hypothetical protein